VADGGGLENRYGARVSSWVRIPHPPHLSAKIAPDLRVCAARGRLSVRRAYAAACGLRRPAAANTRPSRYVSHRRLCGCWIPDADRVSSGCRSVLPCEYAVGQGCGNVLVVDTGGDQGPE
jgi:hypothetical protein